MTCCQPTSNISRSSYYFLVVCCVNCFY
ncbi:hypothetical protein Ahia01_001252000, partial [Argonauta hians]